VVLLGAGGLALALAGRRGAGPGGADSWLAVLPFTSSGGDTANAYFAEGIADEVTNTLSQVPGVRLAGRSSAERFAGRGASPEDVGRMLHVAHVLDGSVRRAGNRIRVTAELSSTRDGMVVWHENYERPASDVFGVQDEIARAIAGQLQVTLAGAGAAASRGTANLAAYDLYLHAMYLYRRRGPAITSAIADFEQALVLDSTFARAWAGLATALAVSPYYIEVRMGSVLPRARIAAERAVRLDSTLADAHLALGFVLGESYDYPRAEAELKRAIAINPDGAEARYRLGWLYLYMGRGAEAIPTLQQAKARDPVYFLVLSYLGLAEISVGHFDEGLAEEERALELEPTNIAALSIMTQGYAKANRGDSAVAVARRIVAGTRSAARLAAASFSLARNGHPAEADSVIRYLEALPDNAWTKWTALALAWTGRGNRERAIAAMQRAAAGDGDLFVSYAGLIAGELPPDPRVDAVWRRFNLDPARFASRPKATE
jgi:serine/threonine-protein kinase